MGKPVAPACNREPSFIVVVDDRCPVVRKLSWLVKQWDRHQAFRFIGSDSTDPRAGDLIKQLCETPWSLMLINKQGHVWLGPEAIPFILKNLPSGKIAAVAYTVPGTMWLTRKMYHMISRNRELLSPAQAQSNQRAA